MIWQSKLLSRLDLAAKQCFIISDPEHLCFEPIIAAKFEQDEAVFVDDTDPISVRLVYENWLEDKASKALIIRYADVEDCLIPFDITKNAISVDFHINEIIPELEVATLRGLSPTCFQPLIESIASYRPGKLGRTASLDFLLRHLYKIAPEIIQTEVDLVRLIIRKHYLNSEMPVPIELRLITLLKNNISFLEWDFDKLMPNKAEFFEFLQAQWALYLQTLVTAKEIKELKVAAWPEGKLIVPFEDQDIQVFIDNLFADGLLRPVSFEGLPQEHWHR
jgi:hypothetical protein